MMMQTLTEVKNLWFPIENRLREEVPKLLSFPRYFEIETVNACNAECPMCTIDDWTRRDGLMSDELFEKIAQEICEHSDEVRRVHLYRDGEPLLDKRLATKVARLKAGGVRRVGISTNAALLHQSKAEGLLLAGLDEIILSIDSLNPRVYEEIRKGLKFEEVYANCVRFIEQRDRLDSDCQIWVRMIRQESNDKEWPEYERFWNSKLRASDRVDFRRLHNWGGQLIRFEHEVRDDPHPCVALWSLMCIFADGSIPLCNVDYNLKHPIGNVRDSSIKSLWESQKLNEIRETHLMANRQSICRGCDVWAEGANA